MTWDWLLFAVSIVVLGLVGIGVGLFLGGRLSRWGERSVAEDGGAFMAAAGPPDEDTGVGEGSTAGGDAGESGDGGDSDGDSDGGGDGGGDGD